jgi:hypothetical protein
MASQVCHHWLAGRCRYGDTCRFQHGVQHGNSQQRPQQQRPQQRPQLCKFFLRGSCRDGARCAYRHDTLGAAPGGASASGSPSATATSHDARRAFRDATRRCTTTTSSYLLADCYKAWLHAALDCLATDPQAVLEALGPSSLLGADAMPVLKDLCRKLKADISTCAAQDSGALVRGERRRCRWGGQCPASSQTWTCRSRRRATRSCWCCC